MFLWTVASGERVLVVPVLWLSTDKLMINSAFHCAHFLWRLFVISAHPGKGKQKMLQCLSLTAGDRPSGIRCYDCYVSTPPLPFVHKQLFVCSNFVSIYHAGSASVILLLSEQIFLIMIEYKSVVVVASIGSKLIHKQDLCNIAAADAIAAGHATAPGIPSMYFNFAFAAFLGADTKKPCKKCITLRQQHDMHLRDAIISRHLTNWLHWWACNTILRKRSYAQLEGQLYLQVQMPFVNKASFSVHFWRRCGSPAFQSYQDVVHRVLQIAALSPGCTRRVKLITASSSGCRIQMDWPLAFPNCIVSLHPHLLQRETLVFSHSVSLICRFLWNNGISVSTKMWQLMLRRLWKTISDKDTQKSGS